MIYTVTLNPSLDYILTLPGLRLSEVNRSENELYLAGGKGINVSIVLAELGVKSTALGFLGGFVGEEIEKRLRSYDFICDFIRLKSGESRINVKLKADEETEINARGPLPDREEYDALLAKLKSLKKEDILVLSGSAPQGMSSRLYAELTEFAAACGAETVVDASGDMLYNALSSRPFLIKPNIHELGAVFGRSLTGIEEVIGAAKQTQELGARNVLVSMGAEGAVLLCEDGGTITCSAPSGKVVNSTGAGDSAVAGFLAEYIKSRSMKSALQTAVAAGSASAFSQRLAAADDIFALRDKISLFNE